VFLSTAEPSLGACKRIIRASFYSKFVSLSLAAIAFAANLHYVIRTPHDRGDIERDSCCRALTTVVLIPSDSHEFGFHFLSSAECLR
jgi:hypothetical protein